MWTRRHDWQAERVSRFKSGDPVILKSRGRELWTAHAFVKLSGARHSAHLEYRKSRVWQIFGDGHTFDGFDSKY